MSMEAGPQQWLSKGLALSTSPWRLGSRAFALALLAVAACSSSGGSSSQEPDAATDATSAVADAMVQDSWASFASGFFDSYCSACHGAGDTLRDYSLQSVVQGEKSKIRCGVSAQSLTGCRIPSRQFPIGNGAKPSDAERERLVKWIDNGAQ